MGTSLTGDADPLFSKRLLPSARVLALCIAVPRQLLEAFQSRVSPFLFAVSLRHFCLVFSLKQVFLVRASILF